MRFAFLIIPLMLTAINIYSQNESSENLASKADLLLIQKHHDELPAHSHKRAVMQSPGNSIMSRYNPVTLTLKYSMLFYQRVVSPQIAANCPYEVSCSQFAKKSMEKYGIIKGVVLGADRLSRCNHLSTGDIPSFKYNTHNKYIDDPGDYQLKDDP